jgi:hypothetical protein
LVEENTSRVEKKRAPLKLDANLMSNRHQQTNNVMKKNVMFLALMMMSTSILFAQRQRDDSRTMDSRRSERLKKELSLNDDQVTKMKAIHTKFAERHSLLRRDTALTVGSARKQSAKLRAEQEAELKGVLTPEQWTKLTAMKSRHGDWKKKHYRGKTEKG